MILFLARQARRLREGFDLGTGQAVHRALCRGAGRGARPGFFRFAGGGVRRAAEKIPDGMGAELRCSLPAVM